MTDHAVAPPFVRRRPVAVAAERARAAPTWVWLAAIVTVSTVVRGVLAVATPAPWIIPDELIYTELARGLAEGGGFEFRGSPFTAWSFGPLYPMLIAPFYALADDVTAYTAVKAANAVLFSLAALPAYALARRVLSRGGALAASALAVAVPSSIYTTKIMSENASYPVLLAALLAVLVLVERPSIGREALALAAIGVAVLSRAQMVVLLPALLSAIVALGWLEREPGERWLLRTIRRYRLTSGAVLVVAAVGVALAAAGGATEAVLGIKGVALEQMELAEAPKWLAFHVAGLSLYVAVIPLVAAAAVAAVALRAGAPPRLRAFVVVGSAFGFWLLALVAAYASQPKPFPRIYDRYVFYLVPLLLICTLVWAESDIRRPRRVMVAAAVLAAGLPALLPYEGLLNGREWGVSSSTVGLVMWYGPKVVLGPWFVPVVLLFTSLLALRAVRASGARALLLPVVLTMLGASLVAHSKSHWLGGQLQEHATASDAGWIDAEVGDAAVVALWPGDLPDRSGRLYFAHVEHEFFNRSVGRALHLGAPLKAGLPSTEVVRRGEALVSAGTGRSVAASYVLTDARMTLAAPMVRRDARTGMTLYRVDGPIRLRALER